MREIRVKNLDILKLVHIVIGLKDSTTFFARPKFVSELSKEAVSNVDDEMSFINWYGDCPIKTIVKFKKYCDEFLIIESITVDNNLLFRHSFWTCQEDKVVLGVE